MKQREQPTFEQFILKKAERNLAHSKRGEESRCQIAVTMTRRDRADTLSDRFGYFSPNATGMWLDERLGQPQLKAMRAMRFLPILRMAVSVNMAAMVTAAVKVTADPAVKQPEVAGIAAVCQGCFDFFDGHKEFWSQKLEALLAKRAQLQHGFFLRTKHNPSKVGEQIKEPTFGEEAMPFPGEYACQSCASKGPFAGPVEQDEMSGMSMTACPECGEPAEVITEPSEENMTVPTGESVRNAGGDELTTHTPFEIRMDDRPSTHGGNLSGAKWFEYHYLATRGELETENPGFDLGAPAEWGYSLKWLRSLRSGTDDYVTKWQSLECDEYEVRELSFLPEDYASYRVPAGGGFVLEVESGVPLTDEMGQPVFQINPGDRLIEKFPTGFRVRLLDKHILPGTPDDPGIKAYDFRTEWTMGGFKPDASSVWFGPLIEVLEFSDNVCELYTIDFEYKARNSRSHIVTTDAFEDDEWEHDITRAKPGAIDTSSGDEIRRHVMALESPSMRQAFEGLEFHLGIAPQVGSAPPVALGAPDTSDSTYGGQMLKHQRSMMLLAPYNQSKAEAKVSVFTQLAKLAQSWPDERLQYIRSRFGEEWRDQDIQAFREADLDKLLDIGYKDGTETPTTRLEREQKMGAFLLQMKDNIPLLLEAKIISATDVRDLISDYAELSGLEVDLGDDEGDRRLAEARYRQLKAGVAQCQSPEDIQVLLSQPIFQPLPGETLDTHVEFWTDRMRALMAAPEPDLSLVACCVLMLKRQKAAAIAEAQEEQMGEIQANAPMQQLEAQSQSAAGEQESGKIAADKEAQGAQVAHDAAEADAQREHEATQAEADRQTETEHKAMELQSKERVAALAAQQRAAQPTGAR